MKANWETYRNERRISWDLHDAVATVVYDWTADTVEHDDGTWSPLEFTYVEVPDDQALPWWVIECVHGEDGVPRVRGVHSLARQGGREVRAVDLRRLRNLDDVIEDAWRRASRRPATVVDEGDVVQPRDFAHEHNEMRKTVRGLRRQARRKITPNLLAEVAAVYRGDAGNEDARKCVADGAPTKAVGLHFGKAPSTASLYVKLARDAGLDLPDPQPAKEL